MGLPPEVRGLALFAGGAGIELGVGAALRRIGVAHRAVCYVEREAYAAAVLAARMEEGRLDPAPVWSDVTAFDGIPWRGRVDLITGGFPCKDISNAGKREGIEGERSGLWREYARIVREVRPSLVFVENVGALLVRGVDRVLGDLAGLGFDAEWTVLRASDIGAPHQRARVFILARAVSDAERERLRIESERDQRGRGRGRAAERGHAELGEEVADASDGRRGPRERHLLAGRGEPDADRRSEGMAHAVEPGLERRERGGVARARGRRSDADAGGPSRGIVADAAGDGRGEGRTESARLSQRSSAPIGRKRVVDADGGREPETSGSGRAVADTDGGRLEGERRGGLLDGERASRGHDADRSRGRAPWPPGPDDREGWIRYLARWPGLEPSIRRGADGMASGLDMRVFGPRVDQLRMLGNGVVPDQAEAAFLHLSARLGLWEGE